MLLFLAVFYESFYQPARGWLVLELLCRSRVCISFFFFLFLFFFNGNNFMTQCVQKEKKTKN